MSKTKPSPATPVPAQPQQRRLDPRNPIDAIDGIDILTRPLNVGTRDQCDFFNEAINTLRLLANKK